MNPSPKERLLAQRALARRRLSYFTRMTLPSYSAGWVHEDICRRLERFSADVIAKKSPRLMLLLPPRSGKSELASIRFPAWHLGHAPNHEIINAGYNLDLPMIFSRKVRELLRTPVYQTLFPGTALDPDSQGAEAWRTTTGGGFCAAGVGGGITGKGAHCVIPYCTINTDYGSIPASKLRVGDYVYGYNHEAGRVERTRIQAISVSVRSTEALRCGSTVLTSDHRVFAGDKYVPAIDAEGMPGLRLGESATRSYVQTMFFEKEGELNRIAGMRALRDEVHKNEERARESGIPRGSRDKELLWPNLLSSAQEEQPGRVQQNKWGMRRLREYISWKDAEEVLQPYVLYSAPGQEPGIGELCSRVVSDQSPDRASGQGVPTVWGQAFANGGSPRGPHPHEQRYEEFSLPMHAVPQEISCVAGTSAEDLARLLPSEDYVVDFQTGTENFFAGGLLVHNCLIVDDPLKNLEEADNAERRDLLEGWYQSTAYTRLAPGGGVLFIETWWNDDDLAGRLQAHAAANAKADQFEVVKYPAISEQHEWRHRETLHIVRTKEPELDKETLVAEAVRMKMIYPEHYTHDEANIDASQYDLIRRPNEALHPERYDLDALLRIKNTVEPRIWSALYQQNPVPDEGMYFQKSYFRYQPSMPRFRGLRLFTAWDFAIGQKQANDWTVGVTLLQDENDVLYVIDVERFRGDTYTIVDRMLAVAERFATEHTMADYMIGVEDGQIWKSVEPVFSKVMMERGKFISYETMKPFTDKLARARPLQGRMQQGRVVFPTEAHWLGQTEQELLRFPAGAHDDVVDALAWAVRLCLGKAPPALAEAKPFRSWKDDLETGGDSGASHMCA